uniref:Uncharacterized protein n=1 Tax=viral metagenome TaxID=1070528 RepID=A0A6M3IJK4_9ZZZZ
MMVKLKLIGKCVHCGELFDLDRGHQCSGCEDCEFITVGVSRTLESDTVWQCEYLMLKNLQSLLYIGELPDTISCIHPHFICPANDIYKVKQL